MSNFFKTTGQAHANYSMTSAVEEETILKTRENQKILRVWGHLKMKKLIYCIATVCMLFFAQTMNAQITLEHTFDEEVYFAGTYVDGNAELFVYDDWENNQLKLYNTDYSLYKSINIILPAGYDGYSIYYITKELFNDDNKIEFIVQFVFGEMVEDSDGNHHYIYRNKIILYNEDGVILKDFGEEVSETYVDVIKVNEQFKLMVRRYDYGESEYSATEIYSLPGKISSIAPISGNNISKLPYPNPTNATITLPYKLQQGETSIMRIHTMNGQLIETKQIDATFDKLLLNVSKYARGMYLYEVNGVSNRFIVR